MRNIKYDGEHSVANTPNFVLRTVLLFFSALYTGINCLLFMIMRCPEDREMLIYGIILCAVFAVVSIINIFDNRTGMKSRFAVIVWLCIYAGSAFMFCIASYTRKIAVPIVTAEIFIAAATVWIILKSKKL